MLEQLEVPGSQLVQPSRNVGLTWHSIQQSSAGLSERHSMLRGPLRQLLKVMGMSSASGSATTSRTKLPALQYRQILDLDLGSRVCDQLRIGGVAASTNQSANDASQHW